MSGAATTNAGGAGERSNAIPGFLQERVAALNPRPVDRAIVAYSGGLDSVLCAALLERVYGCREIRCVLGDIGQGQAVIDVARQRVPQLDGVTFEVEDLQPQFFGGWLPRAIRANAVIGDYPFAAPMIKQLLGRHLGEKAASEGYPAVVDGASGLGNDQFRFATALAHFAPNVRQLSPIRELRLTRREEIDLCELWGLDYDRPLATGGDDVTPWCRSIASGAIHLNQPLDPAFFLWTALESNREDSVEIELAEGLPVAIDGQPLALPAMLDHLNPRLGGCGIGLIDSIEDNRLGLKGREIYEAPAAVAILTAKAELEAMCLTPDELAAKREWERRWADLVYRGEGFHPLVEALDAAIGVVQRRVGGKVRFQARHGALRVSWRHAPNSLMHAAPHLEGGPIVPKEAIAGVLEWQRALHRHLRRSQH
jgi:argininosuccinate synthase